MAVILVSKGVHAGRIRGGFLGWQYLARVLAQSAASERKHSEERLNGGYSAGVGLKTLRRVDLMTSRWLDEYGTRMDEYAERMQYFVCMVEALVSVVLTTRQVRTKAL